MNNQTNSTTSAPFTIGSLDIISSSSTSTTTTSTEENQNLNNDSQHVALIIIISIIIIIAVIAGLIFLIIFIRRKKEPIKLARQVSSRWRKRRLSYHPVSVKRFGTQYHSKKTSGDIDTEFQLLAEHSNKLTQQLSREIGLRHENKDKNRYVDIIPYDRTLVPIKGDPGAPVPAYINASFIKGMENETFIATQGPKRNTVVDFWNMVLEYGVSTLVCLTNVNESGRVKCLQYWPNDSEMLHFDEVTLQNVSEVETNGGDCNIRKIEIYHENQENDKEPVKTVTQFHYTAWLENGTPKSTNSFLNLCQALITHTSSHPNVPVVVHCSTGSGRTGIFLASLFAIQHIDKGAIEIDLANDVKNLREQRPKMVQSLEQYNFIYTCVQDFIDSRRSHLSPMDAVSKIP